MWAQLIKARVKRGREDEVRRLPQEFEQRGRAAWERLMTFQDQHDPSAYYVLVVFESEEKARENERSPEQAERLRRMQELFEGPPEYVDLNVVYEASR